jgi:hypothetical protein
MKADGLDEVRTEPVMVPRWVRGHEAAEIVDPPRHPLDILGLAARSPRRRAVLKPTCCRSTVFDDLRAKQAEARGRIVLFDVAYTNYQETVTYRTAGARAAAGYGARCGARQVHRSHRPSHDAHRQCGVHGRSEADTGGGDFRRGCQSHRSADGGRQKVRVRMVTSGVTHPDVLIR